MQTEKIPFSINLGGKLITGTDPLISTLGDFQSLVNNRYTNRYPESVLGMTKINATVFDYTSIKNGFYFRKDKTLEEHTFAHTFSGSSSKIKKSDNTASIPEQDTFSDFLTLSSNIAYFNSCPDESMMIMDGSANYVWSGNEYRCSKFVVYDDKSSTFRYDYTIPVSNTINDAQDRATMYVDADGKCTVLVGSVRPLSGAKFYIGQKNTNSATVDVKYWTGSTWTSCSSIVDRTILDAGKTLSQTGIISFTSTVTTAYIKLDHDQALYFYKFIFSGLNAATTVYHCTVQCPIQAITDIWDGEERPIGSFQVYAATDGSWENAVTKVLKQDYNSSIAESFMILNNHTIYMGFTERMMGLRFYLPASSINTSAYSATVYYWNGTAWTTVGTVEDGTLISTATFHQTGTISWNPPNENTEFKTNVQSTDEFYYYKIVLNINTTYVDYITGVPAPKKINPHRFSMLWNNTLWLCNDQNDYKNGVLGFAPGTCSVANGAQSINLNLGNDEELVAGATLFSRFGGSIYDNMILFKRGATYLMDGNKTDNYRPYCISAAVGCVAPLTVKTCDTSYEVAPNLTKHVVIWQSDRGIEYFDGNAITLISEDIDDFFNNPSSPNYIDKSLVSTFSAFYDETIMEYHWLTDKREMVYDVQRKKWFEIDRGTGKVLTCGFSVSDPYGNKYTYGGTTGYLERLENGTDFDGNDITYDIWTVDTPMNLKGNIDYIYKVRNTKIVGIAKNDESIELTFTIYADTKLTGETICTFSQTDSTKRVFRRTDSINIDGYCHSFRLQGSSNATEIGLQILNIGGLYDLVRADTY